MNKRGDRIKKYRPRFFAVLEYRLYYFVDAMHLKKPKARAATNSNTNPEARATPATRKTTPHTQTKLRFAITRIDDRSMRAPRRHDCAALVRLSLPSCIISSYSSVLLELVLELVLELFLAKRACSARSHICKARPSYPLPPRHS